METVFVIISSYVFGPNSSHMWCWIVCWIVDYFRNSLWKTSLTADDKHRLVKLLLKYLSNIPVGKVFSQWTISFIIMRFIILFAVQYFGSPKFPHGFMLLLFSIFEQFPDNNRLANKFLKMETLVRCWVKNMELFYFKLLLTRPLEEIPKSSRIHTLQVSAAIG